MSNVQESLEEEKDKACVDRKIYELSSDTDQSQPSVAADERLASHQLDDSVQPAYARQMAQLSVPRDGEVRRENAP